MLSAVCRKVGLPEWAPPLLRHHQQSLPAEGPMARGAELLLTASTVLAAGAVAIAAIHREFFRNRSDSMSVDGPNRPTLLRNWERLHLHGIWIGDSNAELRIVEFADFECPYCRRFHESFTKARAELGRDVALLLIQYPLSMHRFARPAALASECAEIQGRFEAFANRLLEGQDSFGLKSWAAFANDAGISDTAEFGRCIRRRTSSARLESGIREAQSLKVRGTPTIFINGWRYPHPPTIPFVQSCAAS